MDTIKRRALLKAQNNPNKAIDYLITLEAFCPHETRRVSLRYVPDKQVLESACFETYINNLFNDKTQTVETLANRLLEDINNELVVRWVQVIVFEDLSDTAMHSVVVEDHQPHWENPHLIARMTKI
ncbi:conserved hypothetical protein [Candidatus Terasakiella magnetica]|uniref:Uncharacterized protein n=1 Tax=Candidatus Terasakiella magnetica TaxID=1867952 RepID=A0A1C3RKR9_9PROT|nr:hypothetical protein [Candidatus Terasakiella magnetica]SCA57821.1 conserved hypothetical protein [Candidatus Terasakiella magnetica]